MSDNPLSKPPQSRTSAFKELLSQPHIDLHALKALASQGIPDQDPAVRALTWKLLLNYLPTTKSQWEETIQRRESDYAHFCKDLIIDPNTLGARPAELFAGERDSGSSLERKTVSHDDHPLSTSDSSKWRAYFSDIEIREQIDRDVDRTHPDLNFFSGQTKEAQQHRDAMRRALFIFAKLNPGLRYVQGMNELFAVLYHTFAIDGGSLKNSNLDENGAENTPSPAETAAFFSFIDLLGDFRDNFCQQADDSAVGIKATMSRLSSLLRAFDPLLYTHLEQKNKVNPQFYAFRWITTLLTQEFTFPEVVRLWDTILSGEQGDRGECLLRICVAMVLLVREELLTGDFAENMKLLQHYPPVDVEVLINKAEELQNYKTVIVLDE